MKCLSIKYLAFVLIVALAASNSVNGNDVKRVTFSRGSSVATYSGRLPMQYAGYHAYIVRAKRGQRLTIKLTTSDPDASFSIYETKRFGPDEDTIFLQDPAIREHTAVMPIPSEYSIQVYGVRDIDDPPSAAKYSIEIRLL